MQEGEMPGPGNEIDPNTVSETNPGNNLAGEDRDRFTRELRRELHDVSTELGGALTGNTPETHITTVQETDSKEKPITGLNQESDASIEDVDQMMTEMTKKLIGFLGDIERTNLKLNALTPELYKLIKLLRKFDLDKKSTIKPKIGIGSQDIFFDPKFKNEPDSPILGDPGKYFRALDQIDQNPLQTSPSQQQPFDSGNLTQKEILVDNPDIVQNRKKELDSPID